MVPAETTGLAHSTPVCLEQVIDHCVLHSRASTGHPTSDTEKHCMLGSVVSAGGITLLKKRADNQLCSRTLGIAYGLFNDPGSTLSCQREISPVPSTQHNLPSRTLTSLPYPCISQCPSLQIQMNPAFFQSHRSGFTSHCSNVTPQWGNMQGWGLNNIEDWKTKLKQSKNIK